MIKLKIENSQVNAYDESFDIEADLVVTSEQWQAAGSSAYLEDGKIVLGEKYNYADLRRREYPPISEQLDMLYWDAINGTTTWKDLIESIKAQYPKEQASKSSQDVEVSDV